MADRAVDLDELIPVVGAAPQAIAERVMLVVRGVEGMTVLRPQADVAVLAQSYRRLGTKRTRQLSIRLIPEPQRVVVALRGSLAADLVEPLRAAIAGGGAPAALPPMAAPPQPTGFAPAAAPVPMVSAPPPDWFVASAPAPVAPAVDDEVLHTVARRPAPATLRLTVVATGQSAPVGGLVLVGRDPTPRATDVGATLLAVADEAMSKTHLALGRSDDRVWVEDRGSTNGSSHVDAHGRSVTLDAHRRVVVDVPALLVVGDSELRVERG